MQKQSETQHDFFRITTRYSNEEIFRSLLVGNTGGVRVKILPNGKVDRIVIFTSFPTQRQLVENPYHDRMEGNTLIYTGAGKSGDQFVSGVNARLLQQIEEKFPIYAFIQVGNRRDISVGVKRWEFIGLLEYLRCYQEQQIDAQGKRRSAWIFEFRVHSSLDVVKIKNDKNMMNDLLSNSGENNFRDREVVDNFATPDKSSEKDKVALEIIRRDLLACEPRQFEIIIQNLLIQTGFEQVEVTKYSHDGGIDVNARPGRRSWALRHLLIQIQAKKWLHTVGRKEIAELRGSLQPYAAGCIVTTSHFSKAAVLEATEIGKNPISIIDGFELAGVIKDFNLKIHV